MIVRTTFHFRWGESQHGFYRSHDFPVFVEVQSTAIYTEAFRQNLDDTLKESLEFKVRVRRLTYLKKRRDVPYLFF